ncbi:putative pectinesterase 67 [Apostasia shenzhenica]|nr:putative pectinesterase 67 [Apostasia shenzhenica]
MALLLFVPFLLLRAPLAGASVPVELTVVVDSKGGGNFTSVQQAIDFIPADNQRWTKIHITAGVYT